MYEKMVIIEELKDIESNELSGNLEDIIKKLQLLQEENKHLNGKLVIEMDAGYNGISAYLKIHREETDKEFNDRVQKCEIVKNKIKKKELKQLENLAKKHNKIIV